MGRMSPNYFVQDGVIPRTKLPEVLDAIEGLAEEYGMIVANVFHAGDGNLHPLVCFDGRIDGEAARAEELSGRIMDACLQAGGSITGEHGVGVDKKRYMAKMFAEADLDAFQRLRCAFDPAGPREPRQGDADAAAVRRGPGHLPRAPARGGRPGGAVLRPASPGGGRGAAARARRPGAAARRRNPAVGPAGRGHRARDGGARRGSSSTTWATSPRCWRRACRSSRRRRRSPPRGRCSRSTRRPTRRPRSAARWRRTTPGRCGTATAGCATSWSARRSRSPTARWPPRAGA